MNANNTIVVVVELQPIGFIFPLVVLFIQSAKCVRLVHNDNEHYQIYFSLFCIIY